MSYHARPEYTAPDDQRCGALVPAHPGWAYDWAKVPHRCPKGACQMRGPTPVCHVHARARKIVAWTAGQVA